MTPPSQRLDAYLVDIGAFDSRARAQGAIRAGLISIAGAVTDKPSARVASGAVVEVIGDVHPYVSRGGVKLAAALEHFRINPEGLTCLDLGASTGGFTDVLLRGGAAKVYAVDVGRDQMHETIRADPRVVNFEATHADKLSAAIIPDPIDTLVADVSFISLKKALPPALALCAPGARLVALVKPQFEVGRAQIGKGGLVKPGHANTHGVAEGMVDWIGDQGGWTPLGYTESPVRGGDGNQEFLLGAIKSA